MISEEAQSRISEEEEVLEVTTEQLRTSEFDEQQKLHRHAREARELTSRLVEARRDVDKQMLSSDEAVSHQLSKRARDNSKVIKDLLHDPYFARIVLEEETPGGVKEIEFKIGKKANIESNIIDWKNAPLARLFYEYEEGEEYLEDIRGRERSGLLKKKSKVKIEKGDLREVSCSLGTFKKDEGSWIQSGNPRGSKSGNFTLPDILSLITAEQFQLITEESTQPIILHGVAGSGKTSVALHRLAWQLERDSQAIPLVLTPTELLSKYVVNSLEALDAHVPVTTIQSFLEDTWKESGLANEYTWKNILPSPHVSRLKGSLALGSLLVSRAQEIENPLECIRHCLASGDEILARDTTKLLNKEIIRECLQNYKDQSFIDALDLPLILLHQRVRGNLDFINKTHVFLDEFQESSAVELALIGSLVKHPGNLTITGDAEQQTRESVTYKEAVSALLLCTNEDGEKTSVYPLTISHRSTIQIMRFADQLLGKSRTTEGRAGKPPLVVQCSYKGHAFEELLDWIQRVSDKFTGDTILLLCKHDDQAKSLASLLRPKLGDGVCLLSEAPRSTDGMVLIASIRQSKGLEFPHVAIWDVSSNAFPNKAWARRQLYLAATRAEEHLTMFFWNQPSPLIPSADRKLHRLYDARPEEHEQR